MLAPLVTGCGADEETRDYSVPGTLCGIRVDAEELTPFLPPGKKLSVKPVDHPTAAWCDVSVDGKLAVRTVQKWWRSGHDTAYFLRSQTLERVEESANAGRYVYSGWQARRRAASTRNASRSSTPASRPTVPTTGTPTP
ncbi:hypothetical protein [Streptomyces sp. NPDC004783]|uniref:hypothetical protein n=1 Tax=Streptomyces sp. NPDC004783 TaxID=3154459 RepID=UPI0033BEA00B